jgi:hypothetical protein
VTKLRRHNSISTRNQRLAAISSFYRWMQSQDPARMTSCQDTLAIPAKKKAQPGVNHLTAGQTRRLLAKVRAVRLRGCVRPYEGLTVNFAAAVQSARGVNSLPGRHQDHGGFAPGAPRAGVPGQRIPAGRPSAR